ncbi:MAG: hypothetical protein QNJ51_19365 [Calothrix sp. MO_167.B12]|nr:hypothetical protein [Calothrix sp. MO_167.B12]
MIQGYVYHRQLVVAEDIDKIIEAVKTASNSSENYYFLRYSYKVSGICAKLPTERGEMEGQMFNAICELRWKKYKTGYEALILSRQEFKIDGFEPLTREWKICEHQAYWHKQEPKFPKGFTFKGTDNKDINPDNIDIHQRYFQDSTTATIHFVALTLK